MSYYKVESRQQDEGWLRDERVPITSDLTGALRTAERWSQDSLYGMARVIDINNNRVIFEFSAGHIPWSEEDLTIAFGPHAVKNYERVINVMHIAQAENVQIQQGNLRPISPTGEITIATQLPIRQSVELDLRGNAARVQSQHIEPDLSARFDPVAENPRNRRLIRIRPRPEES